MSEEQVRESTVLFWSDTKGWGMLRHPDHPDEKPDVFCHFSSIVSGDAWKTLRPEQRVRFILTDNGRGPQAVRVEGV